VHGVQFSVKAFEANVAAFPSGKFLPNYNAAYEWMLKENFLKLTDFNLLLDAVFCDRDLLSTKTLEYWDFLVSNAPWFNAVSAQALEDAKICSKDHDRESSIIHLENILSRCAGQGKGRSVSFHEEPAKRRRMVWKEVRGVAADSQPQTPPS
jgi:hypothetical protein